MSSRARVLVAFLAVLPLLWAFCPCCLGSAGCGSPGSGADAAEAVAPCPCCPHEAPATDPGTPPARDCEACASTLARAGTSTPASPALPPHALVGILPTALAPTVVSLAAVVESPRRSEAPPDPGLAARLDAIASVVLLI